jgi:prolyl oligopeptidase
MPLRRLLLSFVLFSSAAVAWQKNEVPPVPATPKQPVVDQYHGVKVTDDYRWLEDDKNPQVIAWTAAQDAHARGILDPLSVHAAIYQFMKKLADSRSPSYYNLNARAGILFAMNSQPGKQQDMLVMLRSADDPGSKRVIVDPGQADPTNSTAIQFFEPSPDGSKVALSLASGGQLMGPISVYDIATGHALPDVLTQVSGLTGASVAWSADSTGFYYTHFPHEGERPPEDLNFYEQVYFHKLGTPQSQDTYALGKDFPRIVDIHLSESQDDKYVLAGVGNGDGNRYEHFLRGPSGQWKQFSQFSDEIKMVAFGGDEALYMFSHQNAPRGKILRVPLAT